jgi:transcription-repair coupling factor (superfamily II helicase)
MELLNGIQPTIEKLAGDIRQGRRVVSISGTAASSAKALVLAALQPRVKRPFVVIAAASSELDMLECDLRFWAGGKAPVLALPSFDTDVYSGASPHAETEERRALALWKLSRSRPNFLVTTIRGAAARTASPAEVAQMGAVLTVDQDFPPELLVERLVRAGYVREDPISNIGQFSSRGGIIDVWSPDAPNPVRIEFFGDTVESVREFDPVTQLSIQKLDEAEIAPMREFSASPDDLRRWAGLAEERFSDSRFSRNLKDRTDFAAEGETFSGWEFLFPLVRPLSASLFDHVEDPVLVIDEPRAVEAAMARTYDGLAERYEQVRAAGDIALSPTELFLDAAELRERLDSTARIEFRALGRGAAATDEDFSIQTEPAASAGAATGFAPRHASDPIFLFPVAAITSEVEIASRASQKFRGDIRSFASAVAERAVSTLVVSQTQGIAERIEEILREYGVGLPAENIRIGDISSGFELPAAGLVVYNEADVFGETVAAEPAGTQAVQRSRRPRTSAFISDFRDLKPGDLVVHVDHGIGRFEGLKTIASQGAEREFMLLIYADDAKLFVPVERMDLVSRYSSGEGVEVTLDRLGGLGWQKTKARAKRAMRDMADELLRLYAERKLVPGYAFSPDAPWQHEFEDAFPFELTPDQATAIEDVKGDMETPRPMDRLIVGDVGYGKTEVAMRAAFKAVMDGRQVAVLAPTTILAYQHYESFKKRFAAFPATIELLSRFRSTREQKSVVDATEKGDVDVLIGTHRILSTDVKLPKLGLVIVDEEQRFGVAHKEKLKQLKKKVDVLTLSATPIPRTLNMSLLGMRDMSVIETPPRDRLAINTQVVQFTEGVIRSAIELELARSGQVFFIHNRVETIEAIAALIKNIVPEARIAIGHGQMNEKEMEQIMLDFIDHKYDILVATTIIENGIDIPRANTIIINRADTYGLSQLYQLRGRVGRSNRRAYAYLLIPSELELTPIARRRLTAIREFSDLGAGFRIAALDLELRGAGNILGGQQSGHLDALGFDLYTKMLERTIAEIRGDEIADETSVSVNLGVDVSIPKDYISDASQRLRTYKRISSAESEETLAQIHREIADRYGRIPAPVENLFAYGRLRKTAEQMRIVSIDRTPEGFAIKLGENARVAPERLMQYLAENEGSSFSPNGILRVPGADRDAITHAQHVLASIRAVN